MLQSSPPRAQSRDVLNDADLVVHRHDRDDRDGVVELSLQSLKIHPAPVVESHIAELETL